MSICFQFLAQQSARTSLYLPKRCRAIAVKFTLTAFFALIAMTDAWRHTSCPCSLIALAGLLEMLIGHIYYFNKCYLRSNALFENYFSNEKSHFIRWLKVSHSLSLWHADTGCDFHPYGCADQLAGAILCRGHEPLYPWSNIINYADEYETLMKANVDKEEEEKIGEGSTKRKPLSRHWPRSGRMDSGEIVSEGTVHDRVILLPSCIPTSYLSTFIKEEFGMNFSSWIASLRLEEAKKMMRAHPECQAEGYRLQRRSLLAGPYFSSVFAKSEGVTPSAWMKKLVGIKKDKKQKRGLGAKS